DQVGVVAILGLREGGQVPVIAPAAPDKEAPPATERILPKKPLPKPLGFKVKFPDNLYLVRAKVRAVGGGRLVPGITPYEFAIEQVYAGSATLKGKSFTYEPPLLIGSGPFPLEGEQKQVFVEMRAGTEMLWWIRHNPGGLPLPVGQKGAAQPKGDYVPVLTLKDLEYHEIQSFPYVNSPLGAGFLGFQSWPEGLDWAQQVELVYKAQSPEQRGQLLQRLVTEGRRPVARWALAMLCNSATPELRKELEERGNGAALLPFEGLMV